MVIGIVPQAIDRMDRKENVLTVNFGKVYIHGNQIGRRARIRIGESPVVPEIFECRFPVTHDTNCHTQHGSCHFPGYQPLIDDMDVPASHMSTVSADDHRDNDRS